MITKLIKVQVKPGHMPAYLAAQEVWNRETQSAPGYLGCLCGKDPKESDTVYLQCFWRTGQELQRWMDRDHDRIAALAGANAHYEQIEVRVLEEVFPSVVPGAVGLCGGMSEAAEIQSWSEMYRASAALRVAVQLGVFNRLKDTVVDLESLASTMKVPTDRLERLLLALSAMGLITRESSGWRNTAAADRLLVEQEPAYQGDMVLHNTQPEYVERVFGFGQGMGLTPEAGDSQGDHQRFLRAMGNTAAAGQAEALALAVDLSHCRTMLDVGGGLGSYAIALCQAYPELRAVILDQPATLPLARTVLERANLGDRVRIEEHDYRRGPFPGPVDVVLISNVLRGETPAMIDDMLGRVRDALAPGGRLLISDLFIDDPPANPGLRASLFGLHLKDGSNYSFQRMVRAVEDADMVVQRVERFTCCVVMNGLVEARRPPS